MALLYHCRLLQCSCHLGLLGRAMDVDQKETDQLEVQFSSMSLNSATGSGGISRCVRYAMTVTGGVCIILPSETSLVLFVLCFPSPTHIPLFPHCIGKNFCLKRQNMRYSNRAVSHSNITASYSNTAII